MSTAGQFSSKNPTIKRIMKEASELNNSPSSDYHAAPLENDIFEWHFTLRGPPAPSPFAGGLYHGRINLPPAYPMKPPTFKFTTPTGRFEVNREICLSISGHHEETWQPAWGIRTALVAIRSFMDTDAKGQLGGMDAGEELRKRYARQSAQHRCQACGKTNEEIMKEQDEAVKASGIEQGGKDESLPSELRLAYREELSASAKGDSSSAKAPAAPVIPGGVVTSRPAPATTTPAAASAARPAVPPPAQTAPQARQADAIPAWIDQAIYGVIAALVILFISRYLT